jgi:hypothetical protein
MSHEPAWMGNNDPPPAAPAPYATPARGGGKGGGYCNCTTDGSRVFVINAMSFLNVSCCVLMFFSALSSIVLVDDIDDVDLAFVSVYTMFFAVILFIYEMLNFGFMEYCREGYKKQMGFLYKPGMRGVFLIFVAFLVYGLKANPGMKCADDKDDVDDKDCVKEHENWLGYTTGALLQAHGLFIIVFGCMNPDLIRYPVKEQPTTTQMPAHDNGPFN